MVKLINYTGGFQDNYRALIVTKDGRKLVFNVINPDSFIQYLSATQTSIGLTEQEHLPLQLETRSIYLDNFKMTLRVAENFARAFMFFYLVYILKRFLTTIRGGISSKCRFFSLLQSRPTLVSSHQKNLTFGLKMLQAWPRTSSRYRSSWTF